MGDERCRQGWALLASGLAAATEEREQLFSEETVSALLRGRITPISKKDGGVRPIVAMEALLKVSGLLALASTRKALVEEFSPLQWGLSGTEGAVHCMRAATAASDDSLLVTVDARNAYGTVSRDAVLRALTADDRWAPLRNLSALELCREAELVAPNGEVVLQRAGLRQGSTLAPALFSLALHPVLRACRERHPDVELCAYLDDVSLVGGRDAVFAAYRTCRAEMAGIGLSVHAAKCGLWSRGDAAATAMAIAEGFHREAISDDGAVLLGAMLGSPLAQRRFVEGRTAAIAGSLGALAPLRVQTQWHLATSVSLSRATHLLRLHPPEATMTAAESLDTAVWRYFSLRVGDVDPPHLSLLRLPTSLGGGGLRSQATVAEVAYDVSSRNALGADPPPPSQHDAVTLRHRAVLEKLPEHLRSRAALSARGSGWLTSHTSDLPLDDEAFTLALRLRVGAANEALLRLPTISKTARHDLAVRALSSALRAADYVAEVEPASLTEGRTRPDILAFPPHGRALALDVTVVAATDDAHLRGAAAMKHRAYGPMCEAKGVDFSPFVIAAETTALDEEAAVVLDRFFPRRAHTVARALQVAVARGNSAIRARALGLPRPG